MTARTLSAPPLPAGRPGAGSPEVTALLARHRQVSYGLHVLCGGFRDNAFARDLPEIEAALRARGIPIPEYR